MEPDDESIVLEKRDKMNVDVLLKMCGCIKQSLKHSFNEMLRLK